MMMWQPIETAPKDQTFLAVLNCAGEQTICTMRWAVAEAKNSRSDNPVFHVERVTHWMPLPDPPGAQNIPDGWLRAIDEALVVAHIGVANASDTYEQAKVRLNSLICFHIDVATDPAVNGGYKLVPIEPTETFYQCFSAYDGTSYSNPFKYDDFVKDWREALAAAPEAKP